VIVRELRAHPSVHLDITSEQHPFYENEYVPHNPYAIDPITKLPYGVNKEDLRKLVQEEIRVLLDTDLMTIMPSFPQDIDDSARFTPVKNKSGVRPTTSDTLPDNDNAEGNTSNRFSPLIETSKEDPQCEESHVESKNPDDSEQSPGKEPPLKKPALKKTVLPSLDKPLQTSTPKTETSKTSTTPSFADKVKGSSKSDKSTNAPKESPNPVKTDGTEKGSSKSAKEVSAQKNPKKPVAPAYNSMIK